MTPIERAARALCTDRDPNDIAGGPHPSGLWIDSGEAWWTGYKEAVCTVLAAIREPNDRMEDAAWQVPIDTGHGFDVRINPTNARAIWGAMIGAALIDEAAGPIAMESPLIGSGEVALKYYRHHSLDWMSYDTVEEAVEGAYWMQQYDEARPNEVVSLLGETLLGRDQLELKMEEFDKRRSATAVPPPPDVPIPTDDEPAAEQFAKFMGIPAAALSDWVDLSERVKDVWRAKAAATP